MSDTNRCEGPARTPVYYEEEPSDPLGARCKDAASDASKVATRTNDDAKLRDYLRTKAVDRPLEDDVIGNMIPGALAGGAMAGVGRAAVTSSLGAAASTAGSSVAKNLTKGIAKDAVVRSVKTSVDVTTLDAPSGVSKNATSTPVKEPLESRPEPEPAVVGRDRSPYAPGAAPIRIPEAPTVIRG